MCVGGILKCPPTNKLSRLHLDQMSSLRRSLSQSTMVDGKEREFQAVGDPGLVIDASKIVLDDLLLRSKLRRDVLVLAALNDQRHNLHLLWRQPVANPRPHAVRRLHGRDVRALHKTLSLGHPAHAVHQRRSWNVPTQNAVEE